MKKRISDFKYLLAYAAIWILRIGLKVFHVFPIKNNRIVFYSFNGKQYSCNPRRISEYLQNTDPNQYEIIWAFKQPKKHISELPVGVTAVRYRSLKYYYYAKTCKVMVYNVQGFGELSRRKGQIFIQTWHASNGYKKVGSNLHGFRRKLNLLGHKDYSYVMSGANSMVLHRVRQSMGFQGDVIPGTPRMDLLINQNCPELKQKVFNGLHITGEKKILLYAPTWRDDRNQCDYGIDYTVLHDALQQRFGGNWIIAVRLHPNVHTGIHSELPYVVNATDYADMEELLYVVDALISDYSSCIWDFSFTYRPCFLFCNDLNAYDTARSFDLPIKSWGFPVCETMQQLKEAIVHFDEADFRQSIEQHHKEMGSLEDGKATERVCALIASACGA